MAAHVPFLKFYLSRLVEEKGFPSRDNAKFFYGKLYRDYGFDGQAPEEVKNAVKQLNFFIRNARWPDWVLRSETSRQLFEKIVNTHISNQQKQHVFVEIEKPSERSPIESRLTRQPEDDIKKRKKVLEVAQKQFEAEKADLKKALKESEGKLAKTRKTKEDLERLVKKKDEEIKEMEKTIRNKEEELEIAQKKRTKNEKNRENELERALKVMEEEAEKSREMLKEREEQLIGMNSQIRERDTAIAMNQTLIKTKDQTIELLQQFLMSQQPTSSQTTKSSIGANSLERVSQPVKEEIVE